MALIWPSFYWERGMWSTASNAVHRHSIPGVSITSMLIRTTKTFEYGRNAWQQEGSAGHGPHYRSTNRYGW